MTNIRFILFSERLSWIKESGDPGPGILERKKRAVGSPSAFCQNAFGLFFPKPRQKKATQPYPFFCVRKNLLYIAMLTFDHLRRIIAHAKNFSFVCFVFRLGFRGFLFILLVFFVFLFPFFIPFLFPFPGCNCWLFKNIL